jgi:cyclophilin family peptidyl-prolyl cis-trans isomerase/HEAT repeat protein
MVVALAACRRTPAGHGEVDARPAATPRAEGGAARLIEVENRRVLRGITADDLGHSDPVQRRLAARALARIGHPGSVPQLLTALSDEDGEVISWAAHGLGYVCRLEGVDGNDVSRALAIRSATLPAHLSGSLDATFALTRNLGRCATEEAERTLVAWLSGPAPRSAYAALALGDIASRRKELADATLSALLLAATTPADGGGPLGEALYPFGRLERAAPPFADRLLAAATSALQRPGPNRIFAIRPLSRGSAGGTSELERVLTNAEAFDVVERSEAARGLGRVRQGSEDEQKALLRALPVLLPARDTVAATTFATGALGPLMVALDGLKAPLRPEGLERPLYELARWPVPKDAPPTLTRRVVRLRCRAASLLVNGVVDDPLLTQCDPDPDGFIGQRALLDVVGRRPIDGKRLAIFRKLVTSPHPRVREAALELLAGHPEVDETPAIVEAALGAKEVGVVATAAEFITAHPERVATRTPGASADAKIALDAGQLVPGVAAKLVDAIRRRWAPDDLETLGTLAEAAGATRLDGVTADLEGFCRSSNPTLREHAARALSLLREPKVKCPAPAEAAEAAPELGHLSASVVRLELKTDAGVLTLRLDPAHAPVTVTRVLDLARDGFYNGIVVHRVVPGFVVQFGDPGGDGFGGPGRAPLRCETTPAPYGAFDVGVALAGRDTGSSQLFVTLARYPNLDQEYPLIGKAEGDWNAVAEGDVIREVRVLP